MKGSTKPNESTDTFDSIEWVVKNVANHNGRVGQWGISWSGWEVSQGMIDAHPALKASSPQAPPQDQFFGDDYHSGGAYQLMYGFNWLATNARARTGPNERAGQIGEQPHHVVRQRGVAREGIDRKSEEADA